MEVDRRRLSVDLALDLAVLQREPEVQVRPFLPADGFPFEVGVEGVLITKLKSLSVFLSFCLTVRLSVGMAFYLSDILLTF